MQNAKSGIVAAAKDEAPYLLEWIAYHRSLGVDSFFIADNGGTDGTSDLLRALDHAGYIRRLDWIGQRAFQLSYYGSVVPQLRGLVDFVAIIDVDEFLHPTNGHDDICSAVIQLFTMSRVSAVAINWAIYGSSGRINPGAGLVMERFTYRAPEKFSKNHHVKTIVRPEYFASPGINPHYVRVSRGAYIDTEGKMIFWHPNVTGISQRVTWREMRLDHFFVKSRHEFEIKRKRGQADGAIADRDMSFFAEHDRNEVLDPIPHQFVTRTKTEIEHMRETLSKRTLKLEL